jgi:hypothetical protein
MILREFISFDRDRTDIQNNPLGDSYDDDRYSTQNDQSVLKQKELRKTRLTLRMINDIRKASDAHYKEYEKELVLVRTMYAPPPESAEV